LWQWFGNLHVAKACVWHISKTRFSLAARTRTPSSATPSGSHGGVLMLRIPFVMRILFWGRLALELLRHNACYIRRWFRIGFRHVIVVVNDRFPRVLVKGKTSTA